MCVCVLSLRLCSTALTITVRSLWFHSEHGESSRIPSTDTPWAETSAAVDAGPEKSRTLKHNSAQLHCFMLHTVALMLCYKVFFQKSILYSRWYSTLYHVQVLEYISLSYFFFFYQIIFFPCIYFWNYITILWPSCRASVLWIISSDPVKFKLMKN